MEGIEIATTLTARFPKTIPIGTIQMNFVPSIDKSRHERHTVAIRTTNKGNITGIVSIFRQGRAWRMWGIAIGEGKVGALNAYLPKVL